MRRIMFETFNFVMELITEEYSSIFCIWTLEILHGAGFRDQVRLVKVYDKQGIYEEQYTDMKDAVIVHSRAFRETFCGNNNIQRL